VSTPKHQAHYALRDELADALRRDLLGPVQGEHEILTGDAPITVYPVGVLFPREVDSDTTAAIRSAEGEITGQDETPLVSGGASEEMLVETGVSLSNMRRPSSIGLTFAVDAAAERIVVHVDSAQYAPEDADGNPVEAARSAARTTAEQRERWRRVPLTLQPVTVDVRHPGSLPPVALHTDLELRVLVREPREGTVTITVTLVNNRRVGQYDLRDAYCYYQPVLTITGEDEQSKPFVERPAALGAVDPEMALSRLLHRHAPHFARGHGCAAAWDWTPPAVGEPIRGRAAVAALRTEFVPTHEVLLTDSNPDIDDTALSMQHLGTATAKTVIATLNELLDGYQGWITQQTERSLPLAGTEHEAPAETQLDSCQQALVRMRRGVELLADPARPQILRAFQLANLAMAEQRARTQWIRDGKEQGIDLAAGRWRPFQISFLMLCLAGIVDPDDEDRGVADLLWFPTGGGKTEAYLGLIAFTTFLRRLRDGERGEGVTVLMRYTLRLLTLQQFERAAALICAMERQRVAAPEELGEQEISIGMWVGKSATPNTLEVAEKKLKELQGDLSRTLAKENPVQLGACPWCGSRLDARNYAVVTQDTRMVIRCPEVACDFHRGLPVHLVDEAVYHARPTLIIATVDKFAAMPWRAATATLFNRDRQDGTRPPELIVQDELHLISGPLGTLTGLYETAVDVLADRPKVIASTATIRRADEQGGHLFCREVSQFPPSGLDGRDSWFAVETSPERKATRRYLGLLTSSTSQATLLVRTYAALLHHAYLAKAPDEVRDAYWTLVGYFNSLRLLSAAELQVLDDVDGRLKYLADRDGVEPRSVTSLTELSSRAGASEIPNRLKEVELRLPAADVLDVLLATNMISVGVDVDRLGLMAVMGQPQTTAEYIQATSRVGRSHPGLVAVMLNSTRSRDRSHYESFQHFHSALYREVESTSVTPFSARARDRGLHAIVVALARLLLPQARDNQGAARVESFLDDLNERIRPEILQRVERVAPEELAATIKAFDDFVEWWRIEAGENPRLIYEGSPRSGKPALLDAFGPAGDGQLTGWQTLWSLRDVDASSTFFLEK
jgi:hypothetical protein